jgi:hypothetical protein
MSLWGNKDLVGNGGTVWINLSNEVVTGTGTTFSTSGFEVSEGDIIVVGAGATYGHAVISSVTSNTVASIATTQSDHYSPLSQPHHFSNFRASSTAPSTAAVAAILSTVTS